MKKYVYIVILLLTSIAYPVASQDNQGANSPRFPFWAINTDMVVRNNGFQGAVEFSNLPVGEGNGQSSMYQRLIVSVQYSLEKFRIRLRFPLSFEISLGSPPSFTFNTKEWVGTNNTEWLQLYLSMVTISYGYVDDPVYAEMGPLYGIHLGNGTIVNRYTNKFYHPERSIPGIALNLDPSVWNFPYVGIQGMVSNIAQLDLMASRIFVRPLAFLKNTPFRLLEFGGTFAIDRNPYYDALTIVEQTGVVPTSSIYTALLEVQATGAKAPMIIGADIRIPVIRNNSFSLDIYSDYIYQNSRYGVGGGINTKIMRFWYIDLFVAYTQDNVQFEYISSDYDVIRSTRFLTYLGEIHKPASINWKSKMGFFFFNNKLGFEIHGSGTFTNTNPFDLRVQFSIYEGLIPLLGGFGMTIYYEKHGFNTWMQLAELSDSTIGGEISLRIKPVVLSGGMQVVNSTFNENGWTLNSEISVAISF